MLKKERGIFTIRDPDRMRVIAALMPYSKHDIPSKKQNNDCNNDLKISTVPSPDESYFPVTVQMIFSDLRIAHYKGIPLMRRA